MVATRNRGLATTAAWLRASLPLAGLIPALIILPGCQTTGRHATGCRTTIQPSESQTFAVHEPAERICLSLRGLAARVSKALANSAQLRDEYRNLAGIGFLEGFIVDEAGDRDVILVGRRSKARPSLTLDDLIVNMRCIGRSTGYPYCSLDPTPEDMRALQTLFNEAHRLRSPSQMRAFFAKLKSTVGPQQVVIGGVPRNSRHAHVMIDADYHMKKASQGHIALPGVTSYLDHFLNEAKKTIRKGSVPTMNVSMARFWFHIGSCCETTDGTEVHAVEPPSRCPTFQEGTGIVWLDRCPVVALTEKQMSTASGELYDVRQADPIAEAFADDLSEAFPKLVLSVSVYADLENLFRLRALLLAMKFRGTLSSVGFDFRSYLQDYKLQDKTPMKSGLPGLANCRERPGRVVRGGTVYEYLLFPMVCGGVGMDMEVAEENFSKNKSGRLFSMGMAALLARPSDDTLVWAIPTTNP